MANVAGGNIIMPMLIRMVATTMSMRMNGTKMRKPIWKAVRSSLMMNAGIIVPEPGYLAGVRDLVHRHGALLAFDEVKTGLVVGSGGATKLFGVTPDIVCLAKALGGGVPCGAIGGTTDVMSLIADGRYNQIGTFNGNPLTMAAAVATLTEVLTHDAYAYLSDLGTRLAPLREQGAEVAQTPRALADAAEIVLASLPSLDASRAVALGADGVLLGRAWAYALAADGERGVARMLELVDRELRVAMALTGCNRVADIGPDCLVRA